MLTTEQKELRAKLLDKIETVLKFNTLTAVPNSYRKVAEKCLDSLNYAMAAEKDLTKPKVE